MKTATEEENVLVCPTYTLASHWGMSSFLRLTYPLPSGRATEDKGKASLWASKNILHKAIYSLPSGNGIETVSVWEVGRMELSREGGWNPACGVNSWPGVSVRYLGQALEGCGILAGKNNESG